MMSQGLPIFQRRLDLVFVGFFVLNLFIISPIVDLEQLVIADPSNFEYPFWPPAAAIDLVHWWGTNFDPALMARPQWWQMTIWIDALLFFPFYGFATYAWIKGLSWIRIPTIIWGSVLMTNVTIIMGEEFWGDYASEHIGIVVMANLPWFLVPALAIWRMWGDDPFGARALEE